MTTCSQRFAGAMHALPPGWRAAIAIRSRADYRMRPAWKPRAALMCRRANRLRRGLKHKAAPARMHEKGPAGWNSAGPLRLATHRDWGAPDTCNLPDQVLIPGFGEPPIFCI